MTLFDRSCSVSVLSSENRLLQPRGSPSYSQECRAVQLRVKREDCKSFELDCKSFELECISCFAFAYILLLDVHVFIAEAIQETTEAVSSGLLTEAV